MKLQLSVQKHPSNSLAARLAPVSGFAAIVLGHFFLASHLPLAAQEAAREVRSWDSAKFIKLAKGKTIDKTDATLVGCNGAQVILSLGGTRILQPYPDMFSPRDLDYLEKFSVLPSPAGDPKTAGFDTLPSSSFSMGGNRVPFNVSGGSEWFLALGIHRCLPGHAMMRDLRQQKLLIDVLSKSKDRQRMWDQLSPPLGYFPERPKNEFEQRRQRAQFQEEAKALKPFSLNSEVYFVFPVSNSGYDFTRKGYPVRFPYDGSSCLFVHSGQLLKTTAFWPVSETEAEGIARDSRIYLLVTARPVGMSIANLSDAPYQWKFVLEPVGAKFFIDAPDGTKNWHGGFWKEMKPKVPLERLFEVDPNAREINITEKYNPIILAK